MPAREIHFTFDTKVKVNKTTVLQFVEDFKYYLKDSFQEIKKVFETDSIDTKFLKEFIKVMKNFDCVSIDEGDVHGKQKIVKDFIYNIIADEVREPDTVLGIRYLYDEWDYDGCGYDNYYYLTYTNDVKMIKVAAKEAEKAVQRLKDLGVSVEFSIKN